MGVLRQAALVAAIQLAFALSIAGWLGLLAEYQEVFSSAVDSRGYLALADWMSGRGTTGSPAPLTLRPFVYPLVLSLRTVVGDLGIVILQLVLNALTTGILYLAAQRLLASTTPAAVATAVLITNLTFALIAFHALAEPVALVLIATHLWFLVRAFAEPQPSTGDLLGASLALGLAVCTRPGLLPYWATAVALALWMVIRPVRGTTGGSGPSPSTRPPQKVSFGLLLTLLGPVVVQLGLSGALAGDATLTRAGRIGFEERFFPAVYGFARSGTFLVYTDERVLQARVRHPTMASKLRFVAGHPAATVRALREVVWEMNWRSSSSFTGSPETVIRSRTTARRLTEASGLANRVFSWLHLGFIPLTLLALALPTTRGPGRAVLAALAWLNLSLLLGSGLTYYQGDRLILMAMPAWLLLYPAVLVRLAHQLRRWSPS